MRRMPSARSRAAAAVLAFAFGAGCGDRTLPDQTPVVKAHRDAGVHVDASAPPTADCPAGAPPAVVVGPSIFGAKKFVVAGDTLFFTATSSDAPDNEIWSVATSGADPKRIVSQTEYVHAIATNGHALFWSSDLGNGSVIRTLPLTGGTPRDLAPPVPSVVFTLYADDTDVYFAPKSTSAKPNVYRIHVQSGMTSLLDPNGVRPHGDVVAIDRDSVFTVDAAALWRLPKAGGGPGAAVLSFDTQAPPRGVASDGTSVFYSKYVNSAGTMHAVPVTGGTDATISLSASVLSDVVLDGTNLYWLDLSPNDTWADVGSLRKLAKGSTSVITVTDKLNLPRNLVVTSTCAFYRVANDPNTTPPLVVRGPK